MSDSEESKLSLLISSTLDTFGFKKENVSLRSRYMGECVDVLSDALEKAGISNILKSVGSAGEGMSMSFSDTDLMSIIKDVVCVERGRVDTNLTILETDYTNTAPGYTKVVSTHISESNWKISALFYSSCMYDTLTEYPYISSAKIRKVYSFAPSVLNFFSIDKGLSIQHTTNGPAFTYTGTGKYRFENDTVLSVYFYGGTHLANWAERTRFHNWPSQEIANEISEMEGYIVPIGDKRSGDQNLEWRICYTTAEKKLVSTLNDVQVKIYVLLKMVAKVLLKPKCNGITSYVVKNVVFWIAEKSHIKEFSPHRLVNFIQKSLHLIKYSIENNHCPNYMIPERNLLRGLTCGSEKTEILRFLSSCLEEGGSVLLRIPKLNHCVSLMVTRPENMRVFGQWRDEVENQNLICKLQSFQSFDVPYAMRGHLNDNSFKFDDGSTQTYMKLVCMVVPEWISILVSGKSFNYIWKLYDERIQMLMIL